MMYIPGMLKCDTGSGGTICNEVVYSGSESSVLDFMWLSVDAGDVALGRIGNCRSCRVSLPFSEVASITSSSLRLAITPFTWIQYDCHNIAIADDAA